ncbi:YcnI family protein [Streptomyces albus]|uniref:YcnI family copper-binding membrane protein n=1 Tax=Streptomyces TaxID=1883 RepID=UPI0006B41DFC|nr:YcnI family protein [Streptomyces albus]KPC96868.1 membrane protein [Streptomyces sp. NRRL F-6602]MDI6411970.1 YcnI family protein [Streptomyces albus]GHJ22993.1 membrane protein [Streptomyces albus]
MKIANRRVVTVGALAAGAVLLVAGPASAHVSVDPQQAPKGGYSTVNFKVPNEKDDASTVKLEVTFPADHPLVSVMPQPVPGWDVKVEKKKLDKPLVSHGEKITEAVSKVTWSGGKVEPGQFQQFPVSMGQLPEDGDQLVFKALQTYDDDDVVRWIEQPRKGEPEPENPAPVLKLTAAQQEEADGSSAGDGKAAEAAAASSDSGTDSDSDTTARVLGVVGIVVGAAGIAYGVLAGRRRA